MCTVSLLRCVVVGPSAELVFFFFVQEDNIQNAVTNGPLEAACGFCCFRGQSDVAAELGGGQGGSAQDRPVLLSRAQLHRRHTPYTLFVM